MLPGYGYRGGIDLKRQFDIVHNVVIGYEKHLVNTDKKHAETLCSALDRLQRILQYEHSECLKVKKTVEAVKLKILT